MRVRWNIFVKALPLCFIRLIFWTLGKAFTNMFHLTLMNVLISVVYSLHPNIDEIKSDEEFHRSMAELCISNIPYGSIGHKKLRDQWLPLLICYPKCMTNKEYKHLWLVLYIWWPFTWFYSGLYWTPFDLNPVLPDVYADMMLRHIE